METLSLKCNCGKVTGTVKKVTPKCGNRLVCYCKDCQAFANELNPEAQTLNAFGGTEIFQVAPDQVRIEQGAEHLASLRLTDTGLLRWYSDCCKTPIGNTVGAHLPFVGIIHDFYDVDKDKENKIGPVLGSVNLGGATGKVPVDIKGPQSGMRILLRVMRKLLLWKLTWRGNTTPFFADNGKPVAEPIIVRSKSK